MRDMLFVFQTSQVNLRLVTFAWNTNSPRMFETQIHLGVSEVLWGPLTCHGSQGKAKEGSSTSPGVVKGVPRGQYMGYKFIENVFLRTLGEALEVPGGVLGRSPWGSVKVPCRFLGSLGVLRVP